MIEAGTSISHYRVIRSLGSGGMADVYEVEDTRLGRRLALKVLPPELTRQPDLIARFEKEIRAAALLSHPNIVTLFEFGHESPYYFYTMQLLPGGDLRSRMREPMTLTEAMRIIRAMALAFDHAHKRGFVHRDVKPENIMFDEHNTPVLTDFGIAKAMGSQTQVTKTGMSVGTPRYMSPEAAHGKPVDGRADLYALGCILYELLAGTAPYDAPETMAVIYQHVSAPIPTLPERFIGLQPLLESLMAKDPDERIPDAATLLAEIDRIMPRDWTGEIAELPDGQTPGAQVPASEAITVPVSHTAPAPAEPAGAEQAAVTPASDAPRRSHKTTIALLALGIAGLAAVTLFMPIDRQPPDAAVAPPSPLPPARSTVTPAPTPAATQMAPAPTPPPTAAAPPPTAPPPVPTADPATTLFQDAAAAELAGHLDQAKALYQRIVNRHADSPLAAQAAMILKRIEDAAERERRAAEAAERERRAAEAAERKRRSDEAAARLQDARRLLDQALATESRGDLVAARDQFGSLIQRYPQLEPAKTARERIKAIDAELRRREKDKKKDDAPPVIGF